MDNEKDIEIQTSDCGIFLLNRGIYRINVTKAGYTEVYVYEGMVEVAGDNYSRNVRSNQKMVMSNGNVKERPFYFHSSERDGFDQWNEERNKIIGHARQSSSRYLESGYEDYEYDKIEKLKKTDYNKIYKSLLAINEEKKIFRGKFGLKDMKFLIMKAMNIPTEIEY